MHPNGLCDRSCDDCYFRQAGLCALPGNRACPTFRPVKRGALAMAPEPREPARLRRPALAAPSAA